MFLYPELDCRNCDSVLKKERGCQDDGIIPYWIHEEMKFRCPLTFIEGITWEYVKAFSFFEKNITPNGRGFLNESDKYIQSMLILENNFNKWRKEDSKNKKRKHGSC